MQSIASEINGKFWRSQKILKSLENEEGNLKIEEKNRTKSYINYAEEGGGHWALKTDRGVTRSSDKVFTLKKVFKDISKIAEDIIQPAFGRLT